MLFGLRVITTFLIQWKRLENPFKQGREAREEGATSADRIGNADFANESGRVMKTLSATASTRCLSKKIHLLQNRVLGRVQDTLMVAIPIGPIAATATLPLAGPDYTVSRYRYVKEMAIADTLFRRIHKLPSSTSSSSATDPSIPSK